MQLLKYYFEKNLIKHGYTRKKAELQVKNVLEQTENLFDFHGLAWEIASNDLEYYSMYFLKNVFNNDEVAPIAQIHRDIFEDIQNVILNENATDQQGYLLPRGTGKSVFGGLAPCLFSVSYGYKKYVLYGSSIGSTAEKFIKQMKIALEDNERITRAFGNIYDNKDKKYSNNATKIEFSNRAMIEAISSTSSMRGRKNATGDRP